MSNVGMGGNSELNKILTNPSKYIGTGPTEIEKKATKEIIETTKEVFEAVKDTTSNFIKTPEGKAIASGVLLKTVMPFSFVGDAFILGGAAACAKKFLEANAPDPEAVGKAAVKAVESGVKNAGTIAGAAAGAVVAGPLGAVAGAAAAAALAKAASETEKK